MKIEIIATTLKEAIDAEKFGADRIELVTGIKEGGLTPSIALIEEVCDRLTIPVNVMVRPHSKSFVYDSYDMDVILADIKMIKKTKAHSIVFGSLNDKGRINLDDLDKVITAKGELNLTYHRALDSSVAYIEDLEILVTTGIDSVLTSGGFPKATDNYEQMNKANEICKDNGVILLAGSGLNLDNIEDFIKNVGVDEVHLGSGVKYDSDNLKEISQKQMERLIKTTKKPE